MTQVSEGLKASFLYLDIRIVIAAIGVFVSLMAHELLHVILHWGYITSFTVLPRPFVIAEVQFLVAPGYNMLLEEIFAYAITIFVLIATAFYILSLPSEKTTQPLGQRALNYFRNAADRMSA